MSYEKGNRATATDYRIEFTCNSCKQKSSAVPRCRFDVDLSDDTGAIPASIFGDLTDKFLTFTALEAMDHFNQNHELSLEFVHDSLKTKTFLIHIKPVQTQLADARQRYTVLHYSELEREIESTQLTEQPNTLPVSTEQTTESPQLLTAEESRSGSKAHLRLTDKFDEMRLLTLMTFKILLGIPTRRKNWAKLALSPFGPLGFGYLLALASALLYLGRLFATFGYVTAIFCNPLLFVYGHLLNRFCMII